MEKPSETTAADQVSPSSRRETIDELGPDSTGRWLVCSRGSEHVFDLDAGTYCRRPRAGHGRFRHDGHIVRLTRVEHWPRVGEPSFIWVDDHEHPDTLEHWHQSSTIASITALPTDTSA